MISKLKPTEFNVRSLTSIATPHRGMLWPYILNVNSAEYQYRFRDCRLLYEPSRCQWYAPIYSFLILLAQTIYNIISGTDNNGLSFILKVARLRKLSKSVDRIHVDARAFSQLTRRYLEEEFNPNVPDIEGVRWVKQNSLPYYFHITDFLFLPRYFSYGAMFQPGILNVFRPFHQLLEEAEGPNDGLVSVASSKWGGDSGYQGTLVGVSHLDLINWTNRVQWLLGRMTGNTRKWVLFLFFFRRVLCWCLWFYYFAHVCESSNNLADSMQLHFTWILQVSWPFISPCCQRNTS